MTGTVARRSDDVEVDPPRTVAQPSSTTSPSGWRRLLPANTPLTWWTVAAWVVAFVVCLPAIKQTRSMRWTWDGYLHAGVLRDIAHYGANPTEPIVGGDVPSPYFTPYTMALGFAVRAFGGTGFDGLMAAAIINGVLLVAGAVMLTRTFMGPSRPGRALAAPIAIILFVLLWGYNTWSFSGLMTMNALGFVLPYPSTVGIGLILVHWTVLIRFLDTSGWRRWVFLALVAVLAFLIASTHAFSAICDVVGLVLIAVHRWRRLRVPAVAMLVGAVVFAAVTVLLWPYYEVFKLSEAGPVYSQVHHRLYEQWFSRAGLLLLAVPLLARRWWRDKLDPLALGFVAASAIYAGGYLTGHFEYGRVLTLIALCAHLGIAMELAELFGSGLSTWRRRILVPGMSMLLAIGCVITVAGAGFGLVQAIPRRLLPHAMERKTVTIIPVTEYAFVGRLLRDGDVVLAKNAFGSLLPLAYGGRVVVSPYPDAFTPDVPARKAAVKTYFDDPAQGRGRAAVLRRYAVKWVVYEGKDGKAPAELGKPAGVGPDGFRVYRAVAPTFKRR